MLRININITIVDMIKPRLPPAKTSLSDTQCFVPESLANTSSSSSDDFLNITVSRSRPFSPFFTLERSAMDRFGMAYESEGFDWNEYESGLVLGSFYWLHWVTQIPGGILAQRYGPKLVFGLSNFIGCLMCAVIPLLSYYSLKVLIWFRVLQGLIVGLAWPAMHTMTGRWIPPNERSKFVTAYMGSSIGVAALYPLFGYVIAWSSWEWVYHLCVVIGIAWYLGWHFLVFDSPADHPRITADERDYIEKSLGSSIRREAGVIPWRAILTSKPVWITVISQWGGIWGLFTMMTQAPTYFKLIHGWSISMTGILSGVPHLMRTCFAYAFSLLGDRLLEKGTMTRTNVRKLAGFVCTIINGGFIVALAFTGCNSTAAVTFLTLSLMVHGAVSTGIVDYYRTSGYLMDSMTNNSVLICRSTGQCRGYKSEPCRHRLGSQRNDWRPARLHIASDCGSAYSGKCNYLKLILRSRDRSRTKSLFSKLPINGNWSS